MLVITELTAAECTKIICPNCKEKLKNVCLDKNSKIDGLRFKCHRCKKEWAVKTE